MRLDVVGQVLASSEVVGDGVARDPEYPAPEPGHRAVLVFANRPQRQHEDVAGQVFGDVPVAADPVLDKPVDLREKFLINETERFAIKFN